VLGLSDFLVCDEAVDVSADFFPFFLATIAISSLQVGEGARARECDGETCLGLCCRNI